MITLLLAALVLTGVGWMPARRVTASFPLALLLAPGVAALTMTAAAVASLLTRAPLLPWVIASAVAVGLAARRISPTVLPHLSGLELAALASLSSFPLLTFRYPPAAWDARSIWWFHAEWFLAGGSQAAAALGDPVNQFSHPDYPPLSSAATAGLWSILGTDDARLAQAGTVVLTWCGLLLLAALVYLLMPQRKPFELAVGAGLVVVASTLFPGHATNGYVDVLWSAWFAAAAVALLLHPPRSGLVTIGVLALAVAALTKNDALPPCLALVALFAVRSRKVPLAPIGVLAAAAAWAVLVRSLGAEADLATSERLGALLSFDGQLLSRLGEAWAGVRPYMFGPAAWWAAVTALAVPHLVRRRRCAEIGSGAFLPLLCTLVVASTVAAYVLSPHDLVWHIPASVPRVTIVGRVLLLAEVVLWIGIAAAELPGRRTDRRFPAPPPPTAGRDAVTVNLTSEDRHLGA